MRTALGEQDGVWLYQNNYTLPVGFYVASDFEARWDLETGNPADVQNSLADAGLKLWVEGAASGAKGWIDLNSFTQDERVLMKGAGSVCDVILDDISIQGARCADLRGDMRSDHGGNDIALIPGEDIRIYAETVTESGNTAAGPVCQTNSLFQKVANGKIVVSNIRHLENPNRRVSDFHPAANEQKLGLNSPAEQPGAYVISQS